MPKLYFILFLPPILPLVAALHACYPAILQDSHVGCQDSLGRDQSGRVGFSHLSSDGLEGLGSLHRSVSLQGGLLKMQMNSLHVKEDAYTHALIY